MAKISVMLVDDHAVIRQGLAVLLNAQEDIVVVAHASDGVQAVAMARRKKPEIVLTELMLPHLDGVEATRQILEEVPGIKVIMLTCHADPDSVRRSIEAGAAGFLVKAGAVKDVISAIREVHRGYAFFSPVVARRLRDHAREAGLRKSSALSLREAQVLQMVSEGWPNKLIAGELAISIKTVEKHRQEIMNKLEIYDTAGLTRYVMATPMLHPELPSQRSL